MTHSLNAAVSKWKGSPLTLTAACPRVGAVGCRGVYLPNKLQLVLSPSAVGPEAVGFSSGPQDKTTHNWNASCDPELQSYIHFPILGLIDVRQGTLSIWATMRNIGTEWLTFWVWERQPAVFTCQDELTAITLLISNQFTRCPGVGNLKWGLDKTLRCFNLRWGETRVFQFHNAQRDPESLKACRLSQGYLFQHYERWN